MSSEEPQHPTHPASPAPESVTAEAPPTPFHDMDHYLAIPRISGLALSPDGTRLVTSVATLNAKGTEYGSALWELDPTGERPARRITRSAKGESGAVFAASGELYFSSARPNPDDADGEPVNALWQLPKDGGEARIVLSRAGGVGQLIAASDAEVLLALASVLPGSTDEDDDAERRKARKDGKVAAILHSGYPVRFWDSDLGPAEPRLFAVEPQAEVADAPPAKPTTVDAAPGLRLRGVSDGIGAGLRNTHVSISPDGRTAYATESLPLAKADQRLRIVAIDVATGERRTLIEDAAADFHPGPVSPDGRTLVVIVEPHTTPARAADSSLALLDLASGALRPLAEQWDRMAIVHAWLPDGSALIATADDGGRAPVFRVDVESGEVTRLTADDAAYSDVVLSPDGRHAYAIRSSYLLPPEAVRVPLDGGEAVRLPNPAERPSIPGRLEEVFTTAEDGTPLRAWLALPEGEAQEGGTPLLLWIHGGPVSSWNAWTWRWNPWLLAVKGYAVLLPDPALSTGYGRDFIQRGWSRWGAEPYTDLLAITDAALEQYPELDPERTAAMGGSFGGYMANWVAGHTDRFKAIVTHASLWSLEGFGPTTDMSMYWAREMTDQMTAEHSPHRYVDEIKTPMLVIHGDKDYRVPIGEGLRLWYELLSRSQLAVDEKGATAHRFLYFPDENHWILQPQHSKVWYGVVEAFLAEHVLGTAGVLPPELGL